MNHCGIQQNGKFSPLVCPKPRRASLFNTSMNEPVRPLRWQMCYQHETYDSKPGPELLDLILTKGAGYSSSTGQTCTQVASSPPFFCGSPPSRVSNPLIQDARFKDEKTTPISPLSLIPNPNSGTIPSSSPSSSTRKVGFLRPSYGNKPAVRVEGFDCLDRDNRHNCSIPTLA